MYMLARGSVKASFVAFVKGTAHFFSFDAVHFLNMW